MEGNHMRMREVIKELLDAMYDMGIDENTVSIASESTNCHMNSSDILEAIRNARRALAEHPRNCDVGTAEEQFKRYLAFCHSQSRGCEHCPANKTRLHGTSNCDLAWAQMPYEAQEGGADGVQSTP